MKQGYRFLRRSVRLTAIAVLAISGYGSAGLAQTHRPQLNTLQVRKADREAVTVTAPSPDVAAKITSAAPTQDAYILGPGDAIVVELLDVPEYSGVFPIGPDGTLYLPRLRSLAVEGLTVEELRYFLTQQFSAYVRDPEVFVSPAAYRPIRVYVGGEVARPGYYYLSGQQAALGAEGEGSAAQTDSINIATGRVTGSGIINPAPSKSAHRRCGNLCPTPSHRLRCIARAGVTPYSAGEASVPANAHLAAGRRCVPPSTSSA